MNGFLQSPPHLQNTFASHRWLGAYLRYKLPQDMFAHVEPELVRFGGFCAGEYMDLARQAEREKPVHVPYDAWGKRIDEIRVSKAWVELQHVSAREGLIALAYKKPYGELSRLYQFVKLYLFHPSSAFFTCPLAMADGAAKVLETYGKEDVHRQAFSHLTSESPQEFWTSGQWMTEKTGGSDVSQTSTVVKSENGLARLYGTKWFSSATTSQMALALARGEAGLSLFMVPMHQPGGELNHIKVLRLKDKLGTWALPTAELELEGAFAHQIGESGQGVKTVATMLNITRLYNSVCSVGQATRPLQLLRDYSKRRQVFGTALNDQVLHASTFALEEVKLLAGFLLTMELVHLLGKEECGKASAEERDVLRLLTPVCKLFTARSAIQTASEAIEGFGGAGYIEDTGLPVHLRDSQVFPIWEGATNVLSLDMLRVLQKGSALESLRKSIAEKLAKVSSPLKSRVELPEIDADDLLASSRDLAFHLAKTYAFVLLLEWEAASAPVVREQLKPWIELYAGKLLTKWRATSRVESDCAAQVWNSEIGF